MFLASKAALMDETIESKNCRHFYSEFRPIHTFCNATLAFDLPQRQVYACMKHAYFFGVHTAAFCCNLDRLIHFKRFDIDVNTFLHRIQFILQIR